MLRVVKLKYAISIALLIFVCTLLVVHKNQEYVMVAVSREAIRVAENPITYIDSVYVKGMPKKYTPDDAIFAPTSEKAIELLQEYRPVHNITRGSILTWADFAK